MAPYRRGRGCKEVKRKCSLGIKAYSINTNTLLFIKDFERLAV